MLKKYSGKEISFGRYLKFAFLPSLTSFVAGLIYIFIRYV
jgi:Na+/H+ antiporter NhaD/arsenite permease-like protein